VIDLELVYTILLVVALVLNGVALTGSTPLSAFFGPLRETRLITSAVAIDTLVVPVIVLGLALALGLDDVTRAGLVIVVACSAGPIGIALARVARGDLALAVTLVTGIGVLNLLTVPAVTGVLLPQSLALPTGPLLSSLVGLVVVPLALGRALDALLTWRGTTDAARARLLAGIGRMASASLLGAVSVAALLEPQLVASVILGPVTAIALVAMVSVTFLSRAITPDPARRRALSVVLNARAVGLALTVTALNLGDVPKLRATVLAYGGLTQVLPIAGVLIARRRTRALSR